MVKQCLQYAKGYVRIRVIGSSYERFLNMCANHGIVLWDLVPNEDSYEMNLSIHGFKMLRPMVKKSATKVCIIKRYGLPFFLYEYKKRKMLFCGMLFGLVLMMFLSGFIWDIHIEGNQTQTEDVIFDFLNESRITHGMWKAKIDCKDLATQLRKEFENFIWVSVKIEGTRLLIDVQENTDLELDEQIEYGPSDLVSNVNGTITRIITRSGMPQVKEGDTVKKGDPLVIGQLEIIADSGEVANYQYVAADADIYIQTSYTYTQEFPLQYQQKQYSGEQKNSYFLNIFGRSFSFKRNNVPFEQYDVVNEEHQMRILENFFLPVTWGKTQSREYENVDKTYTEEEAFAKAEGNLEKFLAKIQEKGVQIFENNVKIEVNGEKCKAAGEIIVIQKAGKRVERTITENEYHRDDSIDTGGT